MKKKKKRHFFDNETQKKKKIKIIKINEQFGGFRGFHNWLPIQRSNPKNDLQTIACHAGGIDVHLESIFRLSSFSFLKTSKKNGVCFSLYHMAMEKKRISEI